MESAAAAQELTHLPLPELLERFGARTPAPGGGAGAAVAVASGAALTAMAARFAERQRDDTDSLAARAEALRTAALDLMSADLTAYAPVLAARRAGDSGALHRALCDACETPLALAELGVETAEIAAELAHAGNPNVRGDAVAGAVLAAAGVRIAVELVRENVATLTDDGGRYARARTLADRARLAVREDTI